MQSVDSTICTVLVDPLLPIDWGAYTAAEWQSFASTAQADGVVPLLCTMWATVGWPTAVPHVVQHQLQQQHYQSTAQTGVILHELDRMLGVLAPALPVVVLKGADLATTLYAQASLRPMHDIDLLVRREDFALAMQLVQQLGYQLVPQTTAPWIDESLAYNAALCGGPDGRVILEIHWCLIVGAADKRSPAMQWFWQQTEEWRPKHQPQIRQAGASPRATVLQLSRIAQLLYLAAHLVLQHGQGQQRLIWLYDIHLLITHEHQLDWDIILEQAKTWGWSAALYTVLKATQARFATPIPPGLLDALYLQTDAQSRAYVQRKSATRQTIATNLWLALLSVAWATRLRILWQAVFPRPDFIRGAYEAQLGRLWPLGYLLRWLHIAHSIMDSGRQVVRERLQTLGPVRRS